MPFIGPGLDNGFRKRNIYTATAGQTSFSGSDANGITLSYTDTEYLDVYQNGVLLVPGDDYAATTGTSVVLVQGASLNDKVEMINYQAFGVADTVSRADGGTFGGNISTSGALTVTGDLTVDTNTLIVDSTNNSVGIGASPDSNRDLHIKRTGANASILIEETSAVNYAQFIELKDSSTSWFLANRYATSNTGNTGFGIGTSNSGDMLQIDTNGAVVMPSQPCFSVKKGSAQNNIAAGGAAQTITFDTEIFDQGSDFASNTFTAPITGRYKIQYTITVVQMDLDASEMNFRLASSNRNYSNALSPTPFDADSGNYPIVGTYMVDMDANDTVFLQLVYDGGSQLDVAADSYFSGFLVA